MNVDVAIIGASSAGLYAAERLARAGRRVAIFERQVALAPARRTYIITPQLHRLLGELPAELILHRTPLIDVHSTGAQAQIDLGDPDLIIERRLLSDYLVARAERSGALLAYDHRFLGMQPARDGIELSLGRRDGSHVSVRARAVIGADGVFSSVAVAAQLARPPVVQIVQAEVELPANWNPQVTRVRFDASATRYFYWLIPESAERGVVGVVGDEPSQTHELLKRFLGQQGLRPLAYQASHVAMYHPSLRPWGQIGSAPIWLVGDAAGHVKVTTVGGTVSGFYGAEAASQALLGLQSPQRALRTVRRELDVHWWIRRALERLDNPAYDRLISAMTQPVQSFLQRWNRDEMASAIWRLPFVRPQLLGLGLDMLRNHDSAPSPLRPSPLPAPKTNYMSD